ncbi:MAG: hypothetical protein RI572_09385 [Salegentibacter sp.]|uniref:Uncharacterized protein n=1 Tax=Salegentibacter flavus TaxID=287099 RepID=A0A1I5D5Y3_9FLAO|nr:MULTISPECIES: hypothetical protein [Salegentibacter]MDR9457610.1 hypothetical protein [Salegentibacter sp.]SFN94567.1 hypothetical protein SAMN05660413_03183 [Salegentibacter flavus]
MKLYYIDIEKTVFGENEVHEEGCYRLPKKEKMKYIGNFASCHTAVKRARKQFEDAVGCYFCTGQCS